MHKIESIFKQFRDVDFASIVVNYPGQSDLFFRNHFQSEYSTGLTIGELAQTSGAVVSADVIAFDSKLPVKERPTAEIIAREMPKIGISLRKKESDIIKHRELEAAISRNRNSSTLGAMVRFLYGDIEHVVNGVDQRVEFLAKQALSSGAVDLDMSNNGDGIKHSLSFNVSTDTNEGAPWTDAQNATPLNLFKKIIQKMAAKGKRITHMFMSNYEFGLLAETDEIRNFVTPFIANGIVNFSLEGINNALRINGFPQIVIWDSFVNVSTETGTDVVTGWTEGNITFTTSENPGSLRYTDTADSYMNISDGSVKQQRDYMLVKQMAEGNPPTIMTMGVAYALPVLNDSASTCIVKIN